MSKLAEQIARDIRRYFKREEVIAIPDPLVAIIDRHLEPTLVATLNAAAAQPVDAEQQAGDGVFNRQFSLLLLRNAQLQKRVKAFQEGYRDKAFEVTALEIQLLDCRANGADKVTARNNEKLRTKLNAVVLERNEAQERVKELEAAAAAQLAREGEVTKK